MPIYWQHLVEVDACEECGDAPAVIEGRCQSCEEARNEAAAERQYEAFHGSDEPQTLRERMAVDFARRWGRAAVGDGSQVPSCLPVRGDIGLWVRRQVWSGAVLALLRV